MIYSLHGTLVEKTADMAVVECAGVGFCAAIPSSTAGSLPAVGQECTLYTHMNVTENDVAPVSYTHLTLPTKLEV